MTEPQRWTDLLHEVVPPVPEARRTPPIAAIRRRARRRRADMTVGAGAVVLVSLVAALVSAQFSSPPPAGPPPVGALPWAMAKVHPDQHRLSIGVLYPGEPPACREYLPVARVTEDSERVVITLTETPATSCYSGDASFVVPVTLRGPLGNRRLVDGFDGRDRHFFQEAMVPVPTYPPGLQAGDDGPVTAAGDRPGWAFHYGGAGGPDLGFGVSAARGEDYDGERMSLHGREARLVEIPERGRGHGYSIVWTVNGSEIRLNVIWAPDDVATRDELQTVIDGLRWS